MIVLLFTQAYRFEALDTRYRKLIEDYVKLNKQKVILYVSLHVEYDFVHMMMIS